MVGGCGDGADYANDPRPPAPLVITASVSSKRVAIAPARVGAGPIRLTVANVSDDSLDVRVDPIDASGPSAQSGPINPGGTTILSFDAATGTYRVSAKGGGAKAVTLTVGRPRPSAQNDVLLP